MDKLDVWRWAQYTLVGVLFLCLLAFAAYPVVALTAQDTNSAFAVGLGAFLAYVSGMVLWCLSVHYSDPLLAVFFRCKWFREKTLGAKDYHDLRRRLLASEIAALQAECPDRTPPLTDEHERDIPGYKHFLLEVYRCGFTEQGYLSDKIISGWQSCTMMLAFLGTVFVGIVITLAVIPYLLVPPRWGYVPWQLLKALFLAVLYCATGLAFLERNRLFVRDVALSYALRKTERAEQSPVSDPGKAVAEAGRTAESLGIPYSIRGRDK